MADSKDNGYIIVVRAIKINWDNGKQTVLLTSLLRSIIDASEVVQAYFRRWPSQELVFKGLKAFVSINRVCGYGKKLVTNEGVKKKLEKLEAKKLRLEKDLKKKIDEMSDHDVALATFIIYKRRLRQKTKIKDGKRNAPVYLNDPIAKLSGAIKYHIMAKVKIEKENPKALKFYRKTMKEWLCLQNKTTVYELDVALDQILTYCRASLAHLCAYFIRIFLVCKKSRMPCYLPASINSRHK